MTRPMTTPGFLTIRTHDGKTRYGMPTRRDAEGIELDGAHWFPAADVRDTWPTKKHAFVAITDHLGDVLDPVQWVVEDE